MRATKTIALVLAALTLAFMTAAIISQAASPTPKASPVDTPRSISPPPQVSPNPQANLSAETDSSGETTAQTPFPSPPTSPSPVPKLYLKADEYYTAGGKNWVRHVYDVLNRADYPAALFAPAPNLPPCGNNANSSRSWVDFFDQAGKRLQGFCALGKPGDLDGIWFATEEGVVPPSWIYIEINDRQTNTKYKSNLADTTP
jgi:hypothetical protein